MPSVASEPSAVLPSRPHFSSQRAPSEPANRSDAAPFSDLLDSTAPAAEPPARPRQERPERSDRSERSKAADSGEDRAPSAKQADTADTRDADESANAQSGDGDRDTADAEETADGKVPANQSQEPALANIDDLAALSEAPVDAADAPEIDPEQVTPQAVPSNATAVARPVAVALEAAPLESAASPEQLAALQAAARRPVPAGADEAAAAKGSAQAKDALAAAQQEAIPPVAGKDGDRNAGGKPQGSFQQAAQELLAKPATDAALPMQGEPAGAAKSGAEATQTLGLLTPASQGAGNVAAPAVQPQTQAAAVPLSGLAVEIATQAHAGRRHFEIRLDPPELGRIDIRLDVDRDGHVTSRLVVERADTLDLLKRDAAQLERALQQAGLKTSDNALEFSLRQESFAGDQNSPDAAHIVVPEDDPAPLDAMRQGYGRLLGMGGGLDIRV